MESLDIGPIVVPQKTSYVCQQGGLDRWWQINFENPLDGAAESLGLKEGHSTGRLSCIESQCNAMEQSALEVLVTLGVGLSSVQVRALLSTDADQPYISKDIANKLLNCCRIVTDPYSVRLPNGKELLS